MVKVLFIQLETAIDLGLRHEFYHPHTGLTERGGGEVRADALNLTNSPNLNNPNGTFGNPAFGQVTSTVGGERLVRFGARVTF